MKRRDKDILSSIYLSGEREPSRISVRCEGVLDNRSSAENNTCVLAANKRSLSSSLSVSAGVNEYIPRLAKEYFPKVYVSRSVVSFENTFKILEQNPGNDANIF